MVYKSWEVVFVTVTTTGFACLCVIKKKLKSFVCASGDFISVGKGGLNVILHLLLQRLSV